MVRPRQLSTSVIAARSAGPLEALARAGLAARGFTYVVISILAAQIALGGAAPSADQTGAIEAVAAQPFGRVLLILLAFGFAAYALWRWSVAALGGRAGAGESSTKRVARRIGAFATGVVYGGLCLTSIRVVAGRSATSSTQRQQSTTAWLLGLPMGRVLVLAIGIAAGIGGVVLAWWALSRKFERHLDAAKMAALVRRWATGLGVAGHSAGAVLLFLVGVFVIQAADTNNPTAVKGLDQSLRAFAGAPFGRFLVLAIALGLAAYGLYSFVEARYRRV